MDKNLKAFSHDVEVPEIVQAKADAALDMIKNDSIEAMKKNMNKKPVHDDKKKSDRRYLHFFKSQAAAATCVIVLAGAGITAAAAGFHLWSRGMQGTIQAAPEEQQELIDQGAAVANGNSSSDETDSSLSKLAVTDKGITIVPDTVITDENNTYISFSIQGYDLPDGESPFFNSTNIYLDSEIGQEGLSDTQEPISNLSWDASFYDGIVSDLNENKEEGTYDDGTPFQYDANGNLLAHYADNQGNIEFVLSVSAPPGTSMLGQILHVELGGLGMTGKNDKFVGNWNFSIPLPNVSSGKTIEVGKQIEGTNFVLKDISISPVSIRLNYTSTEKHERIEGALGMPEFVGLVLKDGTQYTYLRSGGASYTDESRTNGYEDEGFASVIDPDNVAALLFHPTDAGGEDIVKVPLDN